MAIPKVQNRDTVEVVFQNQSQMAKGNYDTVYASAKRNDNSEVGNMTEAVFLLRGGIARVQSFDKSSVTFSRLNGEDEDENLRVERKFLKSLKVVSRLTAVELEDDMEAMIPADPSQDLEIWDEDYVEHSFPPKDVRTFLKQVKKHYYKKKVKKKTKKRAKKHLKDSPALWGVS